MLLAVSPGGEADGRPECWSGIRSGCPFKTQICSRGCLGQRAGPQLLLSGPLHRNWQYLLPFCLLCCHSFSNHPQSVPKRRQWADPKSKHTRASLTTWETKHMSLGPYPCEFPFSFPLPSPLGFLKKKKHLINYHTNYLLCVLMATDKEVIRMDMQGLQTGKMFHCQDNASCPCFLTNDYSRILG